MELLDMLLSLGDFQSFKETMLMSKGVRALREPPRVCSMEVVVNLMSPNFIQGGAELGDAFVVNKM